MSALAWSLRIWLRQLWPHTPAKRVGYAVLLLAAPCAGVILIGVLGAAFAVVGVIAIRSVDVAVGRRRRGRMPTQKAYFFEGDAQRSARR